MSELLFGRQPSSPAAAPLPLPELPGRKALGLTPKAVEAVEAFREVVVRMREGVLCMPLRQALEHLMKQVGCVEQVSLYGLLVLEPVCIAGQASRGWHELLRTGHC